MELLNDGKAVILMSHLGRPLKKLKPDGSIDVEKYTLRHVIPTLEQELGRPVTFSSKCIGPEAQEAAASLKAGEVLLLENTRFEAGETKGDPALAKQLAELGDRYINDAFGSAHRAHASTAIIAGEFPAGKKGFGKLMDKEITAAEELLSSSARPFVVVLGGAKVSDKIGLIERFIELSDHILIGGAMAYTFIKAKGGHVGNSLVEDDKLDLALELLDKADKNHCVLNLPEDSVIAQTFEKEAAFQVVPSHAIPDGWMGLDIGPEASGRWSRRIDSAMKILWNGPMGVFEFPNFAKGTYAIAHAVAEATQKGAFSMVGGGDSVAAVNKSGMADRISFISTGGGAMLEYLEGKQLPGIQAIKG